MLLYSTIIPGIGHYLLLSLIYPFIKYFNSEIPTSCGPPPAIGNAMLLANRRQEFSSGESVIYQCYRLYEMEGTPIAKCENGHWRGVPRCVRKYIV